MKKNNEKNYETHLIRPVQLYAILICGLIIIAGGIYLVISQSYAVGFLWPRYGERNAGKIYVGGTSTIITGSLLCIFPIYQLIKQRKRK